MEWLDKSPEVQSDVQLAVSILSSLARIDAARVRQQGQVATQVFTTMLGQVGSLLYDEDVQLAATFARPCPRTS